MAMYATDLLTIALELAQDNIAYEDVASKFLEHFMQIAHSALGGSSLPASDEVEPEGRGLWHEADGWFYDFITTPDGKRQPVRLKSIVGLIPLLASCTIDEALLKKLPAFKARMDWFLQYRGHFAAKHHVAVPEHGATVAEVGGSCESASQAEGCKAASRRTGGRRLLSLVPLDDLPRVLARLLDAAQFLSPYGIRSLSKEHSEPYVFRYGSFETTVHYAPAESPVSLFGSNSNWRGPIWLALNFLLVEKLRLLHGALGDAYKVEFPTGSGVYATLLDVSQGLSDRMVSIFRMDPSRGARPVDGPSTAFSTHPSFAPYTTFYEYFDGDTGRGLGASHQTGWTALVAKLLHHVAAPPPP
jgi:hypothetical protein